MDLSLDEVIDVHDFVHMKDHGFSDALVNRAVASKKVIRVASEEEKFFENDGFRCEQKQCIKSYPKFSSQKQ